MTDAGFFQPRRFNSTGFAVVVAIHAAAIGALAMSKIEVTRTYFTPIKLLPIDPPKPPPPKHADPEVKPLPKQPVRASVPPLVETLTERTDVLKTLLIDLDRATVIDPGPPTEARPQPAETPAPPVRIAARIDPRSELQPPYPPAAERTGDEGVVTIRVLIGADGRVRAAEKVRATSDIFYRATERHALRNWRFKPETVDGRPVESWREMTVRFELRANV